MDISSWIILFVVLIFVFTIAEPIIESKNKSSLKKKMEDRINNVTNFSPSQKALGVDGISGIAFDESRKLICLIKQINDVVNLDAVSYQEILSVEIFEDGVTVTKTSRSSQLGGAIVGGLALGGVGAVIGGLSGNTASSNKVSKIDLRITVNNTKNPIHDINFMNTEDKQHGPIYNSAMEKARHWHGLMSVLIKRGELEDTINPSTKFEDGEKYEKPRIIDDKVALMEKKFLDLYSQNTGVVTKSTEKVYTKLKNNDEVPSIVLEMAVNSLSNNK